MSGFDWKGTIGKVAPLLAGILGTPAAGVGVDALCKVFGLEPSPENAQKAAEQIAAGSLTGDQLIALRKAEYDAQLSLQKAGFDYDVQKDELTFKDRDSARNREIQVKDHTPAIGFYLITAGFFGLLAALLKWNVPEANKAVIYTMVGSLGTAWVACVGYYYGSSASSKAKDQMLFNSTPIDGSQK